MTTSKKSRHIKAAHQIPVSVGLPRAQQNERSALCLLALLNLTPGKPWSKAENPLIGITPIMDWAREHFDEDYAPNTREIVRRQTMHQFCDAGIALYNLDQLGELHLTARNKLKSAQQRSSIIMACWKQAEHW